MRFVQLCDVETDRQRSTVEMINFLHRWQSEKVRHMAEIMKWHIILWPWQGVSTNRWFNQCFSRRTYPGPDGWQQGLRMDWCMTFQQHNSSGIYSYKIIALCIDQSIRNIMWFPLSFAPSMQCLQFTPRRRVWSYRSGKWKWGMWILKLRVPETCPRGGT